MGGIDQRNIHTSRCSKECNGEKGDWEKGRNERWEGGRVIREKRRKSEEGVEGKIRNQQKQEIKKER